MKTCPLPSAVMTVAVALALAAPVGATTSHTGLQPDLEVGEQLTHVFSKAVSIKGDGFKEYAARTSGTGETTVTSIGPDAIVFDARYRYDGRPAASAEEKHLADRVTDCWDGKCSVNLSTSGTLFNRSLWGNPPQVLHAGTAWTATIDKPWEAGPPGTETVRVVRLDPRNGGITLVRDGSGTGASAHDLRTSRLTITTTQGKQVEVRLIPGRTTWHGYTTVRKGVIVGDAIMVKRHVTLVSASGRRFEGEQRIYTLENLLRDRLPHASKPVPHAGSTKS